MIASFFFLKKRSGSLYVVEYVGVFEVNLLAQTLPYDKELEAVEAVGQRGDGLEVEVVCRLVEDDDVRLRVRDGGEGDARALPSAQRRGGERHHLGGDAAAGEVRAERLLVRVRAVAREALHQELERREREVDLVGVVLVDQGDADAARTHHLEKQERPSGEELESCGG